MPATTPIQKERHVDVEGATNVRNLGGYPAAGGKTTKWGVIYRGDMLADVPAAVAQSVLVDQLHIHNTYDLREGLESAQKSYDISGIHRQNFPMSSNVIADYIKTGKKLDRESMTNLFVQIYNDFITTFPTTFGDLIKGIIAQHPTPDSAAYVHCTSGKDRTGITCALILELVGVDPKVIREDFLLTNKYYKEPEFAKQYMPGLGDEGASAVLWSVQPCFLDAYEKVIAENGGVRQFALTRMGLTADDIAKLQAILLE